MKKICLILLAAAVLFTFAACGQVDGNGVTAVTDTFDYYNPDSLIYELDLEHDERFLFLEGNNVADGDYEYLNGVLTLNRDYLITFGEGEYALQAVTTNRRLTIGFKVNAPLKQYNIVNGSFETGDLFGWTTQTVFKGEDGIQSFSDEGVRENTTFFTFDAPYNGVGDYVYGFDDRDGADKDRWNERMGVMRSTVFELGGSGFITFMLGGGKNTDLCYMSVRDAETDQELARYGNTEFNSCSYILTPDEYYEANLVAYKADLSKHIGSKMYVEFTDMGGRDWDLLTIDNVVTYCEQEPVQGILAQDLKPTFNVGYVTNQLPNGDFKQGLDYWTVSSAKGFASGLAPTFTVENGVLKSNGGGDASRGLIRSSLFRLDGSGVISMNIGAAQGARYDKDTYVSVRLRSSNREVFRFANRNHDGINMVTYYVDLSNYIGCELYLEIVDNATESYDTIFVSNIVTYYPTTPDYDFSQAAVNLIR